MAKETNFPDPPKGHIAVVGWDAVNERWQAVAVDASGLLQADVADAVALQANAHGYDGSAWQKLPLMWGYTDRYSESISHVAVATGVYQMLFTAVPPGYIYVLNMCSSKNDTTVARHLHFLYDGTNYYAIKDFPAHAANTWAINDNVYYVLKEGDRVRISFYSTAIGDTLAGRVWGYKMAIN